MESAWAPLSHALPHGAVEPKIVDSKGFLSPAPREQPSDAVERAGDSTTDNEPPYIWHDVSPRDTLLGLSLRYGVSESEIKLANDLATGNLSFMKRLKIPRSKARILPKPAEIPVDPKPAMLRLFRVKNKISEAEARYYLESAGWNVESAQAECDKDNRFGQSHWTEEGQVVAEAGRHTAGEASGTTAQASKGMATMDMQSMATMDMQSMGRAVAGVLSRGATLVGSLVQGSPQESGASSPRAGSGAGAAPSTAAGSKGSSSREADGPEDESGENTPLIEMGRRSWASGVAAVKAGMGVGTTRATGAEGQGQGAGELRRRRAQGEES